MWSAGSDMYTRPIIDIEAWPLRLSLEAAPRQSVLRCLGHDTHKAAVCGAVVHNLLKLVIASLSFAEPRFGFSSVEEWLGLPSFRAFIFALPSSIRLSMALRSALGYSFLCLLSV